MQTALTPLLAAAILLTASIGSAQSARALEASARAKATSNPWRVMTFNILHAGARYGRDGWIRRDPRVIHRIRAAKPDLLGVQEALYNQVEQLKVALPDYRAIGAYRLGEHKGETCTVFVRRERFDVEDSGTFWLSETPDQVGSVGWDAALPRVCTWAVLRDRESHARFLYANTHFDHRGRRTRGESAKLIRAWSEVFRLPLLLTGDLNVDENEAPIAFLKSHGRKHSVNPCR